ncbi:MAG: thiamine phosphate synthase [Chitinispirillaceae bacterium]
MSSASLPDFGFYSVLTDPIRGYKYMTELLVDYQIPFVQLRVKNAPRDFIREKALDMRRITEGSQTRLIINDDPHIAAEVDADGVHVGQDDMPYEQVKELVGENKIIGLSTHSPLQTIEACRYKPHYIGIGPVFPTPTKKNPDPVIGLEGMKAMLSKTTVPGVCIGGIDLENLPLVLEAGAVNFCMVRQFTGSENPERVLKEILKIYGEFYP